MSTTLRANEARSGLEEWTKAELPVAPNPKGMQWLGVVGPGVIVLGVSIGSGEFLLGPANFVQHGLSLLWVTLVAVFLQTIFNTELMRYTMATGEPVFTGFMRTRPSSTMWAWVYSTLYFLQVGWPAWAGTAAGAVFFMMNGQLAQVPNDSGAVYMIGVSMFLLCVFILLIGRRIERTLEILNWVMVTVCLGAFTILAVLFVPFSTWVSAAAGLVGYSTVRGGFYLMPSGVDFVLIAALVAYSGCGGALNLTLSNWARDKGYGMGGRVGYIPAVIGASKMNLAHNGYIFTPDGEAMSRWKGWWRIVRADQWGVFFVGAIIGMMMPAMLYVTFIPAGTNIQGLGIAAALAERAGTTVGAWLASLVAFLGAWLLFKTQLDNVEAMVRSITDMLWTGSSRLRAWRGGDVRAVYYVVLAVVVAWGIFALSLATPIKLLTLGANVAAFIFVVASIHLLYINTRLLPLELRPPMWRRVCLVVMAAFYAVFVFLAARSLLR